VVGSTGCGACRSHHGPADGAASACTGSPISAIGDATYYDADGTGNCSFDRRSRIAGGEIGGSPDELVAALNGADYAHAAWCGACLAVSGPGGEVVVRVVDQCPGCKHGDLDLGRDAFARIAPLSAGRVRIAWHEVDCPVSGPIAYQLKSGSSASWIAIQLRNHRHAIDKLEARRSDGSYQTLARTDDNYFVASSGLGAGPFALRVTDVRGQVLEDSGIVLGDAVSRSGAGQFAVCP
jgi:expansin (peptidoglycan-binding protein)